MHNSSKFQFSYVTPNLKIWPDGPEYAILSDFGFGGNSFFHQISWSSGTYEIATRIKRKPQFWLLKASPFRMVFSVPLLVHTVSHFMLILFENRWFCDPVQNLIDSKTAPKMATKWRQNGSQNLAGGTSLRSWNRVLPGFIFDDFWSLLGFILNDFQWRLALVLAISSGSPLFRNKRLQKS